MLKPKIGHCYKLYEGAAENSKIIKVFSIKENIAYYKALNDLDSKFYHYWDFVKFPKFLQYEISSLEMELLWSFGY